MIGFTEIVIAEGGKTYDWNDNNNNSIRKRLYVLGYGSLWGDRMELKFYIFITQTMEECDTVVFEGFNKWNGII